MVHFGKKAAVLTAAGVLAATAVTGCSGSINTDAVVATVGDDEITLLCEDDAGAVRDLLCKYDGDYR